MTPLETASPSPPAPVSASGTGHVPTRASVFKAAPFQQSLLYNINYSLGSRKLRENKKPNKQKTHCLALLDAGAQTSLILGSTHALKGHSPPQPAAPDDQLERIN